MKGLLNWLKINRLKLKNLKSKSYDRSVILKYSLQQHSFKDELYVSMLFGMKDLKL